MKRVHIFDLKLFPQLYFEPLNLKDFTSMCTSAEHHICGLLGLTSKACQICFCDKLTLREESFGSRKTLQKCFWWECKMRFIMTQGKEEVLLQRVEAYWHIREFSFILCCVKQLSPYHKAEMSLNLLGSMPMGKLETLDSGLWHSGTAVWDKTGNKNRGSPSPSKLIFDMLSLENKMMSSSSPAWRMLPDRNRLLTSHPLRPANSTWWEWRLMDIQGDEWQLSRKGLAEPLYVTSLICLQHITYHDGTQKSPWNGSHAPIHLKS